MGLWSYTPTGPTTEQTNEGPDVVSLSYQEAMGQMIAMPWR